MKRRERKTRVSKISKRIMAGGRENEPGIMRGQDGGRR